MSITNDSPNTDMAPGEAFRKAHGISRTMYNLMKKYNCTKEQYIEIRKKRRKGKQSRIKVDKPVATNPQKGGSNVKKR